MFKIKTTILTCRQNVAVAGLDKAHDLWSEDRKPADQGRMVGQAIPFWQVDRLAESSEKSADEDRVCCVPSKWKIPKMEN